MTGIRSKNYLVALGMPLLAASCASSDFKLVQKATATATYYQDSYVWKCVDVVGPVTCGPCQSAVNTAAKWIPLANKVQKIGALPSQEKQELTELIAALAECP
jgi:hypothetical protein